MKIELHDYDMTVEQMDHLIAIMQIERQRMQERAIHAAKCEIGGDVGAAIGSVTMSEQPALPFDGEIETGVVKPVEKVKRTRQKKEETAEIVTETASEDTNAPKEDSEVTSTHSEPCSVSESDIKEMAQNLVRSVGREKVKEVINRFAEKLSEVKVSDYHALVEAFKSLED